MFPMICPLVGAGVADQLGNASAAAFRAASISSLLDSGNSPSTSSSLAGFVDWKVSPDDEGMI